MNALARIPYGYVQALGRTDITGRFHILELIFYIPLLFVLIKTWGIKGAALAWTIRVTADMILLIGASFKIGRLRPGDLYNQALKTTIWPLALFFILANLATKSFWTSFFIVPLGLFFVVGIWLYALTPDEKNWLKGKFLILTRKRL
jgi:O-antigen/teichoic acid export membrane protein